MKITGTFLDEITYDIPSQNWSREDWDKDFAVMKAIGIDTVIIIRCGLRDQVIYPSKVLPKWRPMLPVYEDLGMVFLDLAEKHGIRLIWGSYDTSPEWWQSSEKCREIVEIHKDLIPEIWERYGHHKAFGGWYLTYEFGVKNDDHLNIVYNLGKTAKELSPNLPVMISPYVQGPKALDRDPLTIDEHQRQWNEILEFISPYVDIVA